MKHSFPRTFRRPLALVTLLLLLLSLAGCWKKDKPDETEGNQGQVPPQTSAATTEATTEATTPPTTTAPTEAPTQPTETEPKETGVMGTVTATKLNIRSGAGSEYGMVGTYYRDDRIEILETKGDWGRTNRGWVSLNYVKLDNAPDDTDDKDDKPTNNQLVSDGKTTVLGHGVVNLGSLNVRSGPGTNYEKVDTVSLGERYAYYQRSGNWARIKDGWISVSYFYIEGNTGDGAGTGTVTGDGLNIRSGPGTEYDSVGSFKKDETVKILTQINNWGYTSKGWVSMKYIRMDSQITAGTTGKGTVTADTLNIRKEPSTEADKVGKYYKDDKVEILEVKGDWGRTDKGWVSLEYVKMETPTYKTGKGTITASELNIRKEASISSESVGFYKKDDKVEILEVKGEWGRTNKGWISLKYVKMD